MSEIKSHHTTYYNWVRTRCGRFARPDAMWAVLCSSRLERLLGPSCCARDCRGSVFSVGTTRCGVAAVFTFRCRNGNLGGLRGEVE